MIIIKISILYFIQIRHTDDFPSTGTRLVVVITRLFHTIRMITCALPTPHRCVNIACCAINI